jgi:hypothetical protein
MFIGQVDDCQWFSARPLGFVSFASQEISFALKIDGISTEPDTWKGLEDIAD